MWIGGLTPEEMTDVLEPIIVILGRINIPPGEVRKIIDSKVAKGMGYVNFAVSGSPNRWDRFFLSPNKQYFSVV